MSTAQSEPRPEFSRGSPREALVAEHADRGFRECPLDAESTPADVASLLAGLVPVPAREERGAA